MLKRKSLIACGVALASLVATTSSFAFWSNITTGLTKAQCVKSFNAMNIKGCSSPTFAFGLNNNKTQFCKVSAVCTAPQIGGSSARVTNTSVMWLPKFPGQTATALQNCNGKLIPSTASCVTPQMCLAAWKKMPAYTRGNCSPNVVRVSMGNWTTGQPTVTCNLVIQQSQCRGSTGVQYPTFVYGDTGKQWQSCSGKLQSTRSKCPWTAAQQAALQKTCNTWWANETHSAALSCGARIASRTNTGCKPRVNATKTTILAVQPNMCSVSTECCPINGSSVPASGTFSPSRQVYNCNGKLTYSKC